MVDHQDPSNCIFCKIVAGEIPCYKIAEDDKVIVFLDINPVHPGHALVVPREHHINIIDTPDDIMKACIAMCRSVASAIREELPCDGMNVSMNNFPASGQVVMHTHIHVIPRFNNDGLRPWPQKHYQEDQAAPLAVRLSKRMKNIN